MADNTVLNAGAGGDTIATEDRGTYKTPISLIDVGGRTGAEAIIGDSGVSMPVKGTGTAGTANAGVVTIQGIASMTAVQIADNSGSITVDAPVATPVFVRLSDGSSAITALPITDNSGSITVDNAGTFAVQAAQTGTWTVTGTGGTFPVTDSGGSLTIDNATLSTTGGGLETGALRVTIASDSTGVLSVDDNGGSLTVDGAVAATQSGTWNVGTVTTVTGVTTVTTLTTCGTVTTLTGSGVAHDSADSGNPHKIGAKATTALSGVTLVANADRTDLYAGADGVQIVRSHCNLEDIVSGVAAITDGSSTSVVAAAGAGVKNYVTSVTIANTSATAVTVDLRDGTAGSVKWTFPVPGDTGGVTHTFDPPLPFSANTIVAADPSAAASTVTVSILGFKSKV